MRTTRWRSVGVLMATVWISVGGTLAGKLGEEKVRTWTDAAGRKVEGKLVRVEPGAGWVEIRGKEFRLEHGNLSQEDQEYLKSREPEGKLVEYAVRGGEEKAKEVSRAGFDAGGWEPEPAEVWEEPTPDRVGTLPFLLFTPKAARENPLKRYPVLTFFHGDGGCGDDNYKQYWDAGFPAKTFVEDLQKREPCFVYLPQVEGEACWFWLTHVNPNPNLERAVGALDRLLFENRQMDATRLYVTGLSIGGIGAFEAVSKWPGKFAAAVPVATCTDLSRFGKDNLAPVWAFVNSGDMGGRTLAQLKVMQGFWKERNTDFRITEFEGKGGHDAWTRAYGDADFVRWLFSRRTSGLGR